MSCSVHVASPIEAWCKLNWGTIWAGQVIGHTAISMPGHQFISEPVRDDGPIDGEIWILLHAYQGIGLGNSSLCLPSARVWDEEVV